MLALASVARRCAPLAILAAAACSDLTGSGRNAVSLSLSTQNSAAASIAPAGSRPLAAGGPITVTVGTNTVVITKAQLVMDEIELQTMVGTNCSGGGDCAEMKLDPMVVDLPLDGMTQLDLGALIPAGTYHELEFKVDAVESGEHASAAAFLAAHPDFQNVSVRVEGTFNGEPFVFTTNEDVDFELEFASAVDVGNGATNITVAIDLGAWFRDGSGAVVDPRDPGNSSLIVNNIKNTFHAFEDHDRDGHEDAPSQP